MCVVNEHWMGATAVGVASYDPGEDLLGDPNNFHSNPGYMGTSTSSALQASQPGSIYRTPGGGGGHRPLPVGGPIRTRTPGRTVTPASSARQAVSEGGPLVVATGQAQW
jgi:hypothetical protein